METRADLSRPYRGTILFSLVMLILAAVSNAAMDKLRWRYEGSIFSRQPLAYQQWLKPALSWKNKWKNGDPSQGEAFPLSTTVLVATTDAWHFFKSLMLSFLTLALLAPFRKLIAWPWWGWVLAFVGLSFVWGAVFEICFRWLL